MSSPSQPAPHAALTSAEVDHAHRLVETSPSAAAEWVTAALTRPLDPDSESAAWRIRGLAAARMGRNGDAVRYVERSIRTAEAAELARRAALARLTLAVMHAAAGKFTAALAQADAAEPVLRGTEQGELLAQRGVVLGRIGRYGEALECFNSALRHLHGAGAATWRARAYHNRGRLHMLRGAVSRAESDFRRTIELCEELGLSAGLALASGNLGELLTQRGDIPAALYWLDRAERVRVEFGMERAPTLIDRAETLLSAGLAQEASLYAAEGVGALASLRRAADLAEARLTYARCLLANREPTAALGEASQAQRAFRGQGRPGWAALARLEVTRARWAAGERGDRLVRPALDAAEILDQVGWQTAAAEARLLAGRALVARGALTAAQDVLTTAARARTRGTATLRARAWHAEALRRHASDDRGGAFRALRAGLRVIAEHASALGATELRAHAGSLAADLSEFGVVLAIESGNPRTILEWREQFRSSVLHTPPVRPPRNRALAEMLTALRRVVAAIEDPGNDEASRTRLRAEQRRLERNIRDRTRHVAGSASAETARLDVDALATALGDRALIEFVLAHGALHAITVIDGRVRYQPLGGGSDVLSEAAALRFALHRLARRHGSPASLEAAQAIVHHAAGALDAEMFGPVLADVGDRDLVVVPTMALHALPWGALPSLTGRPVSVAPSARTWLRAASRRRPRAGRTVLVAGPDLDHADAEIRAVARSHPGAERLAGADATADAVRSAMDGAALAHLACHGEFRADNAQFSSLRLADGPLMVYDLERLRRPPRQIVLSACDAGLSAVRPGDELMGLAATLFAMGTDTLVASVAPVDDEASKRLMVDFHRRLQGGASPARALADSQQAVEVAGFTCFGRG